MLRLNPHKHGLVAEAGKFELLSEGGERTMVVDHPRRTYCTYFDLNYLPRGLALWRSLRRVSPGAVLWICCLDDPTRQALARLALPDVHLFPLNELERRFLELAAVRPTRSRVEYYFTCTPSVVRFVLDAAPEAKQVTYLDADLYFFADPEPLFTELESRNGAVGIIAHRFPERLKEREKYGIYNVGWLTFTRNDHGMACLEAWRQECVAWCYNRLEEGKFADQKYLDSWEKRFAGVVPLRHLGANVALWNLDQSAIAERDGRLMNAGQELLFYHFHALHPVSTCVFHTSAATYGLHLDRKIERLIYRPYLSALHAARKLAAAPELPRGPRPYMAEMRRNLRELRKTISSLRLPYARKGEYLIAWPWE